MLDNRSFSIRWPFAIYLLCWMLTLMNTSSYASKMEYLPEFYSRWDGYSNDQLMDMGKSFLSGNLNPDSALVCYTVVVNRLQNDLKSKEHIHEYVRALNNIGYIYYTFYNDYTSADRFLDESLELSEKYKVKDNLPYVYLNKGNVSYIYESMNGQKQSESNVIDNFKKTFHSGIEQQTWACVTASFYGLSIFSISMSTTNGMSAEIADFDSLKMPAETPMLEVCQTYSEVMKAYEQKNFNRCVSLLSDLVSRGEQDGSIHPDVIVMGYVSMARILIQAKEYEQAESVFQKLESLVADGQLITGEVIVYGMMQTFYANKGDTAKSHHYDYLKLLAKNELQETHHLNDMGRNRFLRQLAKVSEDLRQEQAIRFWQFIIIIVTTIGLIIITIAFVLLFRSNRRQQRYVDYLYERNQRLIASNQLLLSKDEEASAADDVSKSEELEVNGEELEVNGEKSEVSEEHLEVSEEGSEESGERKETLSPPLPLSRLSEEIVKVMEQTDIVCSPDFSLSKLCDLTGYNHTYISQAIRQQWNTNFNGLLNGYRIKEACLRMNDIDQYGNYTIEAIALSVGYSSRAHFSTLFKKITGITAAEYLKAARKNYMKGDR